MPAVVAGAAISGLVSGTVIAGGVLTFGFSWLSFAGSLALGGLSHALTPKPKRQAFVTPVDRNNIAVRQPTVTRKHVYGRTRMTDVHAHMTTQGDDSNSKLHAFLVISDDEWTSIDEIWADDYVIPVDWLDASGNVTQGRYANKLRVRIHLGDPNQVADPVAVAEIPEWTDDHRGRGVCYVWFTLSKDRDVYPTGLPNFSVVGRAKAVYDPRTLSERFTSNAALFAHDFLARADYGFQAFAASIDDVNIAAEANICDEFVDTAALDMTMRSVDTTTNIMTMTEEMLLFQLGDRVEVVTAGTPPAGLATGTDYYVIVVQSRGNPINGDDPATYPRMKFAATFDDAMNDVAIDISSSGSGTITIRKTGEPRYHGAGVCDTADQMGDTINDMLNAMAGRAIHTGGKWQLLAGAWREPTLTLTLSDMRGDGFEFTRPINMAEKFNIIAGKYISSTNNYQSADFPTIKYQEFIDDDGGIEYPPRQLHLGYTDRSTTAQRIGKIELFRSRQDIVISSSFSMKGIQSQPGDTVILDIPEFVGFDEKLFEVTQTGFTVGGAGNPTMRMDHTFRSTTEAIYDWSQGEDEILNPPPNTILPNPFVVEVPTGVAFSSRAVETEQADLVYSLMLRWDPHPNAFVTENGQFEIQFKKSAETEWEPSFFVDGSITFTSVLTSSVNVQYDLRIRAVNFLGRRSNWVTLFNASIGTSGGVGATQDWGEWVSAPSVFQDWGDWTSVPGATQDWGFFT